MKTYNITITFFIVGAMMFASCSQDLNVEPDMSTVDIQTTYEAEYLLTIRATIQIGATDQCDSPNCGHSIPLSGKGQAFSNTFGPMDATAHLEYHKETGRLSGIVTMLVRNTDEILQLVIEEKNEVRNWSELNGTCIPATSLKPFAEMNFNGELCLDSFPADMKGIENGNDVIFLINGELK